MWAEGSEKKKEILTGENIEKDLKERCTLMFFGAIGLGVLFFLLFLTMYWAFNIAGYKTYFFYVTCGVPMAVSLGLVIYYLVRYIRVIVYISKKKYSIVEEPLISTETKVQIGSNNARQYYCLNFAGYKRYEIPLRNYKWSDAFYMSSYGVYNYSTEGDVFYLVCIGKQIELVYNKKLFELKIDS